MRKIYFLLISLICVLSVNAQNGRLPEEVVPGSKGELPVVAAVAPVRGGEVAILDLSDVGYDPFIINGYVDIVANLRFPMVSEVGCDYYTIQYRNHGDGSWSTLMENDNPRHFSDRAVGMPMYIYGVTDYRLVLHGGEKDGYVSNIVTAQPISMYSRYRGWSESPSIEHCMVGKIIGDELSFSADTYNSGTITEFSSEDGYFTYQWYRRNPNNWDLTKIEGATDIHYTPTLDDAGYQLIIEVRGDKVHCDFMLRHPLTGVVCVPVQASVDYVGSDGFVLNTDYVIPKPQEKIIRTVSWNENVAEFDSNCISERKAGQYVFRLPQKDYDYCIYDFANPAYFLTFHYEMMGWYREVQLMTDRYTGLLGVKAEKSGNPVSTIIDVIGQNIDGNWSVVASKSTEEALEGVVYFQDENGSPLLFQRPYYVMARATSSTANTYYPNVLTLENAQTVVPGESWNANVVTIEVQNATSVDPITASSVTKQYFTIDGRSGLSRGVNIMRTSDGKVRKVVVR